MMESKRTFLSELLSYASGKNEWKAIMRCVHRTRDWKILRAVCRKKPRLDIDSFEYFIQCYIILKKMKEQRDIVREMEDALFYYVVTPKDVVSAQDVLRWNRCLEKFFVFSGECSTNDEDAVNRRIFRWWKDCCQKHPTVPNVFQLMIDGILEADVWLKAFSDDILFENKRYDVLLGLGQVRFLLDKGQSNYVIAHFCDFSLTASAKKYGACILLVSAAMLRKYLNSRSKDYRFFTLHPDGLQVLIEADYIGVVCRMEKEFLAVTENFPRSFDFSEEAQQKYKLMLGRVLDREIV